MTQQLRLDSELLQVPAPRPRGKSFEDFLASGLSVSDSWRAVDCCQLNEKHHKEREK